MSNPEPKGRDRNLDFIEPNPYPPNKETGNKNAPGAVKAGLSFGSALAITISWSLNKSVLWAIIHGLCSWAYVVYYMLVKDAPG